MLRPIENFRRYPTLQYDKLRSIFILEFNDSFVMYLYDEEHGVKPIEFTQLYKTNIGEPYRDLIRFEFIVDNKLDYMNIDPNEEQALEDMIYLVNNSKTFYENGRYLID